MTITRTIEVELSTFNQSELMELEKSLLVDEILELREMIQELKVPSKVITHPGYIKAVVDDSKRTRDLFSDDVFHRRGTYGHKSGKTSKYHNVCWDKRLKKWIASVTMNGGINHLGSYDDEVYAAAVVDQFLDASDDTKRPRNYKEFDECETLDWLMRIQKDD